jgi:AP-1-like transcription factor
MTDLETILAELQVQHNDLTQSYESLQLQYATVKQELETLRDSYSSSKQKSLSSGPESYGLGLREWEEPRVKTADLSQYDFSVFCFDPEEEGEQKG